MRDLDQAIVRRALSSLLDRLEGGARAETGIIGGAGVSEPAVDQHSRSSAGGDNSIIVVFLGQSDAVNDSVHSFSAQQGGPRGETREDRAPANRTSYERAFTHDRRGMQTTHPGLEKFPIAETESASPAPKTCFMEPCRVCVNSGACEMRGY